MIFKCRCCGRCRLVQEGDGDQLEIKLVICDSPDCRNIYRVWGESQFISNAYSVEEFAGQIHEERRRAK